MFKVGIIGLRRGTAFFSFNVIPEFKVTAICDLDKDLLKTYAAQYNVSQHFTTYEDMIKSANIDIVVIATPIMLHVQQDVQALDAGLDVLSEVPAATTFEECYRLAEAVERNGRKYMMAENNCYYRDFLLLKALVDAGKFGELYFGEGYQLFQINRRWMYNPDGTLNWGGRLHHERDGIVYPSHAMGPLYQMFNERVITVCSLGSGVYAFPGSKLEDIIIALCKTESGKLIKLREDIISHCTQRPQLRFLQGTKGCYEAPEYGGIYKIWFADDCKENELKLLSEYEGQYLIEEWKNPPKEAMEKGAWGVHDYLMVKDFANSILHNGRPPIDVYDALNMTAPGIASELSIAQDGKPIEVPDFKKH